MIEPDGLIRAEDMDALSAEINGYINETDRVPNLVIHTRSVPYWANFDALRKHLNFVKGHHNLVGKVAIVSDSKLLWLGKSVVENFVSAKVRRFNEDAIDDAISWAQTKEDHPGAPD